MASHRRLPLILLALLLLTAIGWKIWSGISDHDANKLRVTVIDVGQGDSILVETPSHRTLLIDGGGSNDETQIDPQNVGQRVVLPFLHSQGIDHLDLLLLTHPHGDHVGGLPSVLSEVRVGAILDGTVLPYPSHAYQAFLKEIQQRQISYHHAARGMHLDLGDGVSADVLNPPREGTPYGTHPDNATVNNYSAVLRLTYGQIHILLDGDAQTEAEASMLASGIDVSADVLKCGHHGAGNATTDAWLDRVHPRYAAISCGLHNTFGHPNPATLARLAAHGVQVYRTDHNGAITFVSDGKTVQAQPFIPESNISVPRNRTLDP